MPTIRFLLAACAALAASDGRALGPAGYGEIIEMRVQAPDREKALQRAHRYVEKAGGDIVAGPFIAGEHLIRVSYKVPFDHLEAVLSQLRVIGDLEQFQRRAAPMQARSDSLNEQLARVEGELTSLSAETHPTAAGILRERKASLEEERRRLNESLAWASVQFSLQTTTAGFATAPSVKPSAAVKRRHGAGLALFSAGAFDERLNPVQTFAESLAQLLGGGGLKLIRAEGRDTPVESTTGYLEKESTDPKIDLFIAATADLTYSGTDVSGKGHVCTGSGSIAIRPRQRSAVVWSAKDLKASGRTRPEACSHAGALLAAKLAYGIDKIDALWNEMTPTGKREFLRRLSALQRSSLSMP